MNGKCFSKLLLIRVPAVLRAGQMIGLSSRDSPGLPADIRATVEAAYGGNHGGRADA